MEFTSGSTSDVMTSLFTALVNQGVRPITPSVLQSYDMGKGRCEVGVWIGEGGGPGGYSSSDEAESRSKV